MNLETFFSNFELFADAPNGVQKLRELILQLAVQGKLVPQNHKDEPAAVLLEKIKAEKERLVKEGKIKKSKKLPPVDVGEMAFDLPQGWEWVRWEDVAFQIGDVDHKMPQQAEDGIPYVSPRDFTKEGDIYFSAAKKISIEDFERLRQKIQPQKDDIIFPRYGTIGVNRYVNTDIDFLDSYSCAVIKNFSGFISPKYSYYYSISLLIKSEITRYINKTTQANVGVKSIQNFIFPLPPLNEQHRIVAKVNQMMCLCDELEAKLTQSIGDREKLMSAAVRQVLAA
ncbi:MAG: restriction endonuclease subunit S [Rivularia sp. (in: cyanobacteria)]